jgi:hypothetical protein
MVYLELSHELHVFVGRRGAAKTGGYQFYAAGQFDHLLWKIRRLRLNVSGLIKNLRGTIAKIYPFVYYPNG